MTNSVPVIVDGADCELRWPRDVFIREASTLLERHARTWTPQAARQAELLLEEAFVGDVVSDEAWHKASVTWSQPRFLRTLVDAAENGTLREWTEPHPYWVARHVGLTAPSGRTNDNGPKNAERPPLQEVWAAIVSNFSDRGYFELVARSPCVDNPDPDPDEVLDREIGDRTGSSGLWPLSPGTWSEETFYELVEVVHDLIARPRDRYYHDYSSCGWHYSTFARQPAQALYRWHVNRAFARANIAFSLASLGEDRGRLVRTPADDRSLLIERAIATSGPQVQGVITHAIALFRGRGAGVEDRRSAIVALAGLLEQRRDLLKTELLKKDEAALFMIANQFDLRHRDGSQRRDYDPAFLDWIFWWYLATVELTERLIGK